MPDASPLGDFLRWHRQRLGPDDVGLATHGRRRVPGLRREEVALLAGISFEYYVRLEQGRERSPSVAVLDALAEAFGLDNDQVGHLHELARPRSRRIDAIRETAVPSGSVLLLNSLNLPAVLQNKYMDVLAANETAEALCPNMRAGVNRFRAAFLDPRERELWRDWDLVAANAVAQLRSAIGAEIHSSPVHALIAEMMEKCQYFRRLWSRHDVQQHALSPVRMRHPRVGDLELYREKLIVAGSDGLVLVMYHAEPGSPSAGGLASLEGSLVA
jgi:transcriptional regulator with XRE-family HTH domain